MFAAGFVFPVALKVVHENGSLKNSRRFAVPETLSPLCLAAGKQGEREVERREPGCSCSFKAARTL